MLLTTRFGSIPYALSRSTLPSLPLPLPRLCVLCAMIVDVSLAQRSSISHTLANFTSLPPHPPCWPRGHA
eukprot:5173971-Pyramimonas_sp.AAC.1